MENICDRYRQIINHAIDAGILPESSKASYLAVLEDEGSNDHNRCANNSNQEEESDASRSEAFTKSRIESLGLISREPDTCMTTQETKQGQENLSKGSTGQSDISAQSVENYSILDMNRINKKADIQCAQESDSDVSSLLRYARRIASSAQKLALSSTRRFSKNPEKNQVVDFKIPIYFDLSKKHAIIKPQTLENINQPNEKFRHLVSNSERHTKALNKEGKETQSISKCTATPNEPKGRLRKRRKRIPETKGGNVMNPTNGYPIRSGRLDPVRSKQESADGSSDASCEICPAGNVFSTARDRNERYRIEGREDNGPHTSGKYIMNNEECYKISEEHSYTEQHQEKKKESVFKAEKCSKKFEKSWEDVSMSINPRCGKSGWKTGTHVSTKRPQYPDDVPFCEYCAYKTGEKCTEFHSEADNLSSSSTNDVADKRSRNRNDYNKMLNVNIICQFYPAVNNTDVESEETHTDDPQDNMLQQEEKGELNEREKTTVKRGIHCLSKIFSGRTVHRKDKKT